MGSLACRGRARPARRDLPPAVQSGALGPSAPIHDLPFPSEGLVLARGSRPFQNHSSPIYLQVGCTLPSSPRFNGFGSWSLEAFPLLKPGRSPAGRAAFLRRRWHRQEDSRAALPAGSPRPGPQPASPLRAEDRSQLPLRPFAETKAPACLAQRGGPAVPGGKHAHCVSTARPRAGTLAELTPAAQPPGTLRPCASRVS